MQKLEGFIGDAISYLDDLLDLAPSAFGGSDPATLFWRQEGGSIPRITFLGPTGARVPDILTSLTDMSLREADLRESIYEAVESSASRYLFNDGTLANDKVNNTGSSIKQVVGQQWQGMTVSGGLLNVGLPEDSIAPVDWIDRVAIPVIVTSARAVMGVTESDYMTRLKKEGRFFVLLVTGVEGDPSQVTEIKKELESFKIKPFMDRVGSFSVVYYQSSPTWKNDLLAVIKNEIQNSHCRQFVYVVQKWIDNWSARLELLWQEDQKKRSQVNGVRLHLADLIARLSDIATRTATDISLNITDQYSIMENTADKTAAHFVANMSESLESVEDLVVPMKKAWLALDKSVVGAPQELGQNIDEKWRKEISSFIETNRSILVNQEVDLPDFQGTSYNAALELWQQLSLERFSTHIIETLEEMQTKYQEETTKENEETSGNDLEKNKWSMLKDVLQKAKSRAKSTDKLEYEVSSLITEGLRRYVRDRMTKITRALESDSDSWFVEELRGSLELWRVAINSQLDEQLGCLNAEEYKGMLLPHRDKWRQLSLQVQKTF